MTGPGLSFKKRENSNLLCLLLGVDIEYLNCQIIQVVGIVGSFILLKVSFRAITI